jgi:hypothetical protein
MMLGALRWIVFGLVAFAINFPVLVTLVTSFKTPREIATNPTFWIEAPTLANYASVLTVTDRLNLFAYLWNSLAAALIGAGLAVLLALPAAYAIARGAWGRRAVFPLVVNLRAVPLIIFAIPIYMGFQWLGLLDTRLGLGLILTIVNLPLALVILVNAISDLPEGRPEQLQLDGDAGHQREQDAGGDQPHGGLDRRLFREAEARQQRAKIADVLGGILTVEADLVQGPPRTGLRGTLEQGLRTRRPAGRSARLAPGPWQYPAAIGERSGEAVARGQPVLDGEGGLVVEGAVVEQELVEVAVEVAAGGQPRGAEELGGGDGGADQVAALGAHLPHARPVLPQPEAGISRRGGARRVAAGGGHQQLGVGDVAAPDLRLDPVDLQAGRVANHPPRANRWGRPRGAGVAECGSDGARPRGWEGDACVACSRLHDRRQTDGLCSNGCMISQPVAVTRNMYSLRTPPTSGS